MTKTDATREQVSRMDLRVDTKMALPPRTLTNGERVRPVMLPYGSMKQGDSFFLPVIGKGEESKADARARLRLFIMNECMKYRRSVRLTGKDFRITTRVVEERGIEGIRVWRLL